MDKRGTSAIGAIFVIGGLAFLILTVGFFLQISWATRLWLWTDGRLSYIFIASITAAIAVPVIWIGWSREFGAAKGGALNLGVAAAGISPYFFWLYNQNREPLLLVAAVLSAASVLFIGGIYLWSRNIPIRDQRIMPRPVKASFLLLTVVLLLAGGRLVMRAPVIFPWPLKPESSVMFGLIFLGAAAYFASAIRGTKWHEARGQLLGFLAYDLILIGPFLAHFGSVDPNHRLSLILYTAVLVFSGGLAIYYLLINRSTRF